jgi:Protein of unknown function (DUF3179)
MRNFLLAAGLLLLFGSEILRVYFIMPFPGSQESNTIDLAYWLGRNILWIRIAGLLLIAAPLVYIFKHAKTWKKILLSAGLVFYAVIFFFFNFRFEADEMFYQPQSKIFSAGTNNKIAKDKLVIGVAINDEAKAYPIQLIGYHHQVRDTIGNTPVMITYCTVCRTGRAFSPLVNGKPEDFRLVGMDHFNAMFEDATTKSWWQQATGVAVAGPLKGKALEEIPSQQLTLAAWLSLHPNSTVMQPDTIYQKDYDDLADYDKGTIKSSLEKRDSASWKFKSWVIGIVHNNVAKAYDWNKLVENKLIQDSMPGLPLMITLEKDTASFHVFNRSINGSTLNFEKTANADSLTDINTQSTWSLQGACTNGALKGQRLQAVQAYQEFWHSWSTFHPATKKYE